MLHSWSIELSMLFDSDEMGMSLLPNQGSDDPFLKRDVRPRVPAFPLIDNPNIAPAEHHLIPALVYYVKTDGVVGTF